MSRRYLIVSDLHLVDVEEHDDGWKGYKSSRFVFDAEFEELLGLFMGNADGADLTLILNGDIVDFDLVTASPEDPPWPVRPSERRRTLDATAAKSAWKLRYVLSHHPRLVAALARYVASGHELVYIMGNHDRELFFPEVQVAFLDALDERHEALGERMTEKLDRSRVRFEPWFYYVPDVLYVEHGQQYDYYTSFRYVLWPVVTEGSEQVLALPMGNLSNRYLINRMGFFNPYSSDYILNVFRYLHHWLKHYAFTRRNILLNWFVGSLIVIGKLVRLRRKLHRPPPDYRERLAETADRYGLPVETVEHLAELHPAPITSRMFRLVRELWIDRLLLATLLGGGTLVLALVPIPLWIKLMLPLCAFPLLFFVYEWMAAGETTITVQKTFPARASAVAGLLPVKVVAFGHTHTPRVVPLCRGTHYVDTGSWAPVMKQHDKSNLAGGRRNFLIVHAAEGEVNVKLDSFMSTRL